MRTKKGKQFNPDLLAKIVGFMRQTRGPVYLGKGHAANREKQRCDEISRRRSHIYPTCRRIKDIEKKWGGSSLFTLRTPPFNFPGSFGDCFRESRAGRL